MTASLSLQAALKICGPRIACLSSLLFITGTLGASTLSQEVGAYRDNQGTSRDRAKFDLNYQLVHSRAGLTASSYNFVASRDIYEKSGTDDEYMQDVYGSNQRINDAVSLAAAQTWQKLTETRVMAAETNDQVVKSRTVGLGASHWFWNETLQTSLDISRTQMQRPVFEILDEDSDIISPPPRLQSTGVTVGAKNLATTTTLMSYAVTHVETNDRPPANTYSAGVRQFIVPTRSAVHGSLARAVNRGRITTKTAYGEVDAWLAEVAYLQTLWRGARSRLGYRYYREDETSRASKNEYVRGSDTYSLSLAQELGDKVIEVAASRYFTNELEDGTRIAAGIVEAGIGFNF